ncbi:MAG: ABC transporter permease [Candidatus Gastranaerophilales bacterium]|nr:ABC transporter permease [Candidatus Gastranaerophilales bacterium]
MTRLRALIIKEFHQMMRDPSTLLIAFILPMILLCVYRFSLNLDTITVTIGIKNEDNRAQISSLVSAFENTKYLIPRSYSNRAQMERDIEKGVIRGMVIIPNDFSEKLGRSQEAQIQVITDGSETNTANFVANYSTAIINNWLTNTYKIRGMKKPTIKVVSRFWYNEELNSHWFVLPGALSVIMTLVGILLTALVVAREWERGTMEALITTRITKTDLLLSKYIPYFCLGMVSMAFCVFWCVVIFGVPFRGSYFLYAIVSGLFLLTLIGQGLLASTLAKNQFTASQAALTGGFLPALMLSGLVYPISSMPTPIQFLSNFISAKYFVGCSQNLFMAGNIWDILIPNSIFMIIMSVILYLLIYRYTAQRLD